MIAFLVSVALLTGLQTPQKSMFQQVVPIPTGNNGYEEYLMAGDIVQNAHVGILLDGTPDQFAQTIKAYEEKPDANLTAEEREMLELKGMRPSLERYQTALKYRNYTLLQMRREALARAGKALDLLNRGNKKRVFEPRGRMDANTLFPEYASFKSLAKLAAAGAYVAYADGQPSRGTQYLIDAIILGQNLSEGILISRLVGVAIQSIAFAAVEKYLPSISGADAVKLEALAPLLVTNPPKAVRMIDSEFQFMSASLEKMFEKRPETEMFQGLDEEEQTVAQRTAAEFMKKLGPAEQLQVIEICKKLLVAKREQVLATYRLPESKWDGSAEDEEEGFDSKQAVNSVSGLATYVAENTVPIFSQVGLVEVKNRTQIRLLGLAGSIIRFKWENDRWPAKLADAAGATATRDPVSGDEFQYEVDGGGFRVYSRGTKNTGEIALKYRRPTGGQNVPPPPIFSFGVR